MAEQFTPFAACHLDGHTQTAGIVWDDKTRKVLGLEFHGARPGWLRISVLKNGENLLPPELRRYNARKAADGRRIWPQGLDLALQPDSLALPDDILVSVAWERS